MLIPLQQILKKHNLSPTGVIHVGAHWAEEHSDYKFCGIQNFVYVEPCKDAFSVMRAIFQESDSVKLFNVACGSKEEDMVMHVSHNNQGQSNSLLEPGLHLQQHPDVIFNDAELVKVVTLDSLPIEKEKYDLLAMDVQGYEGEVLLGAEKTLDNINVIYTEVNRGQTYSGNKEIEWMDGFLNYHGFARIETFWPSPNWTWGDAVYKRVARKFKES